MEKKYFLILISGVIVLTLSSWLFEGGKPDGGKNVLLCSGEPEYGRKVGASSMKGQRNNNNQNGDTVFLSDFSIGEGNEIPYNWKVERHSRYNIGSVIGQSYFRLLSPGNRFLPLMPKMKAYTVDLEMDFTYLWRGQNCNFLRLFYRYDEEGRRGEFVEIIIEDKNHFKVLKGVFDGNIFSAREEILSGIYSGSKVQLAVQTGPEQTRITLDGQISPYFDTHYSAPSTVALEHGGASMQEVRLRTFNLYTFENIEEFEILPPVKIVFPWGIHGMDIPITYTLSAINRGGLSVIRVTLAGSVIENKKPPLLGFCSKIDWLTKPYIRLMGKRYNLSDTTLVLSAPHLPEMGYFYAILYKRPAWPLEHEFILEEQLPKQFIMALGYDYYENEVVRHAAGGPAEVIVDMPSGRILHQGKALGSHPENQFDIQIESPANKEIISLIPRDDPRYELAVNFAQHNHYFLESESCRFIVKIFSREARKMRISYQIENAFFEPLSEHQVDTVSKAINISSGVTQQSFAINAGPMKNGVYHLRVKIIHGEKIVAEDYRAFEVISRDKSAQTPPIASGLPFLFSAPSEIDDLATDYFDPWHGANGLNASHYMTCTTFFPGVARENQIWKTLEVYKRQWYLLLNQTENMSLEANKDLVGHADHVSLLNSSSDQLYYAPYNPQYQDCYTGLIMECLIRFTRTLKLDKNSLLRPEKLEHEKRLSHEGMKELVENHSLWAEWLDFYSKSTKEFLQNKQKLVKDCNPACKISEKGPFGIYVGCYKMGYCVNYSRGIPKNKPEELLDGFLQFEDYPSTCRYNIGRGPLTLASVKLVTPNLKIFPEFYSRTLEGTLDGWVISARPPYALEPYIPAGMYRKRIFEYVYGAVWHNEQGFDYWRDYGFHSRTWSQDQFEILLNAWRTVRDHKPIKPLRSTAYVYSEECCRQHSTLYPEIINTAEEDVAFAWEMSRLNGNAGGFVASMASLRLLSGEDTDCLVLPPLTGATKAELAEIRRLYSEGVALIGFEDVTGLEDLFGVRRLKKPTPVRTIKVNTSFPGNPLSELSLLSEKPAHPACIARYTQDGASALLEGESPAILQYKNTVLFNVPPTLVSRADYNKDWAGNGNESISPLINQAMTLVTKKLGSPTATTTEGRILAFKDSKDNSVIILFADAWPAKGCSINPDVTINLKGMSAGRISCDHDYSLVEVTTNKVVLQLSLKEEETATIVVGPEGK